MTAACVAGWVAAGAGATGTAGATGAALVARVAIGTMRRQCGDPTSRPRFLFTETLLREARENLAQDGVERDPVLQRVAIRAVRFLLGDAGSDGGRATGLRRERGAPDAGLLIGVRHGR